MPLRHDLKMRPRAKIRPVVKDQAVGDEVIIETISMAVSAEAERSHKVEFAGKGMMKAKVADIWRQHHQRQMLSQATNRY